MDLHCTTALMSLSLALSLSLSLSLLSSYFNHISHARVCACETEWLGENSRDIFTLPRHQLLFLSPLSLSSSLSGESHLPHQCKSSLFLHQTSYWKERERERERERTNERMSCMEQKKINCNSCCCWKAVQSRSSEAIDDGLVRSSHFHT